MQIRKFQESSLSAFKSQIWQVWMGREPLEKRSNLWMGKLADSVTEADDVMGS